MNLLKNIAVAFSMYSKIPMPQFAWTKENMRYALCFFLISCMLIQISSPSVTTHCIPYTTVLFPFNHSNIRLKAVFYLFCSYASDNRLSLRELPIV